MFVFLSENLSWSVRGILKLQVKDLGASKSVISIIEEPLRTKQSENQRTNFFFLKADSKAITSKTE